MGGGKKENKLKKKKTEEGVLWWSRGYISALAMQGGQVQSLVRELDPCML